MLMVDLKERSSDSSSTRTVYADQQVTVPQTPFFEQQLPQKKRQFLTLTTHPVEREAATQQPSRVEVNGSLIKPRFSLPTQKIQQPQQPFILSDSAALINTNEELAQQQKQTQQLFGRPSASVEAQPFIPMVAQQPYMMVMQHIPQAVMSQPWIEAPGPPARFKKQQKRRKQKKPRAKMTRGKLMRRVLIVCSILTIIAVICMSQANGASGAGTADLLRGIFGPTITAQVESWYLGFSDKTQQVQYSLGGQHVEAPWTVGTVAPLPTSVVPPKAVPLSAMPLGRIVPMVTPAIDGEGVWATQAMAPAPYGYLPLDARAFIRPDPTHPYAIVTLLQFDTRFFRLHMVAGTVEPGGPRGFNGSGVIPVNDQRRNALLAAFNGGFKFADGQYGLKTNGIVYVPPQPGAATIAVTKSGQIILGAWGLDPRMNNGNSDLVAWRQNAALLINNGTINPLTQDGAAWGGTILNAAYTWRSGIGITAHGTLIYAAGSSLTALTLGEALKAAGAVMAMQTDINPFWVRAFLYSWNAGGTLSITKLNPAMYGTGTEYLSATQRDFFYLTRYAPPLPPVRPREVPAQ
jgi:hypothetical protein